MKNLLSLILVLVAVLIITKWPASLESNVGSSMQSSMPTVSANSVQSAVPPIISEPMISMPPVFGNRKSVEAGENYEYNEALGSVTGYVNGQKREPYASFKYGTGYMKENGCGVIAVHNALVAVGKGKELRDVALYFEDNGAILGGVFGTDPTAAVAYFESNGCAVETIYDAQEFDDVASSSVVSVLTFWNTDSIFDGAHTVALVKNANGSINVYNYYGSSGVAERFGSISAMLEDMGHVAICMLGVQLQ